MPPTGEPKGKKQRPKDKHYHLAKERGYRSRAACKLLQLDYRFRFLPSARAVLDLGAAPGGWTHLAVSRATVGALVIGVDLAPIRPIRGARLLKEDITAPKCRSKVRRLMDSRGVAAFDVVLHDGDVRSDGAGTSAAQAEAPQSALVINAIRLATMFLVPGGAFITKFFRCQDYHAVMFCLKQVGLASDFIWCNTQTPLEFLGSFAAISFDDPASLPIKSHELTTDEIIWLCENLLLIDKNSLKYILKWRMCIRTALSCSQVIATADGTAMGTKGKDDDQLLRQMEELMSVISTKERSENKRQSRPQTKDKAHKAIRMQIDATEYCYGDPDLFFVSDTKGGKETQAVESGEDGDSKNEETQTDEDSDEAVDSDEELQRYEAQLEDMLDEAYERIMATRGRGVKQGVEESDDGVTGMKVCDEDYHQEANPISSSLGTEKLTKEQLRNMWFSQDVFP